MSCLSCNNAPCVCESAVGPDLEVSEPFGSDGSEVPCADCDPADDCCNLFYFDAEAAGPSLFFDKGGPTAVPGPLTPGVDCGSSQTAQCCEGLIAQRMFVFCPPEPIPPGTYMITARGSLVSQTTPATPSGAINPGAKLSIRFAPDCNALTTNEQQVAGAFKHCCCGGSSGGSPSLGEVLEASGSLTVYSSGCSPAIVVYAVNGCPSTAFGNADIPLFLQNLQVTMLKISSRDLVTGCGGLTTSIPPEFSCQQG